MTGTNTLGVFAALAALAVAVLAFGDGLGTDPPQSGSAQPDPTRADMPDELAGTIEGPTVVGGVDLYGDERAYNNLGGR